MSSSAIQVYKTVIQYSDDEIFQSKPKWQKNKTKWTHSYWDRNRNSSCKHVNWKILAGFSSIGKKLWFDWDGWFMTILIPNSVKHTSADHDFLHGAKLTWLRMCVLVELVVEAATTDAHVGALSDVTGAALWEVVWQKSEMVWWRKMWEIV